MVNRPIQKICLLHQFRKHNSQCLVTSHNNLLNILINAQNFIPYPLKYVTIVVDVVTNDLTAKNCMVYNHITNICILGGRLSMIRIINNVGIPILIFLFIVHVPLSRYLLVKIATLILDTLNT